MANNLFIDNGAVKAPTTINIRPPAPTDYPGPAGGRQQVYNETPPSIEMTWGMGAAEPTTIADTLRQLFIARKDHVLSWKDENDLRFKYANVFFPPVPVGSQAGRRGQALDVFTLLFREHKPSPSLVIVELLARGAGGANLTTGDGKAKYTAPAGGFLMAVDGNITVLGTGAGTQTEVQISVAAKDYFSTTGKFKVDSGSNVMEDAVLALNADGTRNTSFDRGAVFELDIDSVPSGGNSKDARVRLHLMMFRV